MRKRIYGLLLALCMALGMVTTCAPIWAEEAFFDGTGGAPSSGVAEEGAIYNVDLAFPSDRLPVMGREIDSERENAVEMKAPDGANYSVAAAYWCDRSHEEARAAGVFDNNRNYWLYIRLTPEDGFYFYGGAPTPFSFDGAFTVNGVELKQEPGVKSKYIFSDSDGSIYCFVKYGVGDVPAYTVTFDGNRPPAEWNARIIDNNADCTATVEWGESLNDVLPHTSNLLRSNHIWDGGDKGYLLENWYTETECISKYDFDTEVVQDLTLYAHWEEAKCLKEIDLDFKRPCAKMTLENSWYPLILSKDDNCSADVIGFYDSEEIGREPFRGTFEAGQTYWACIQLMSKSGCYFSSPQSFKIIINGEQISGERLEKAIRYEQNDKYVTVRQFMYSFTPREDTIVEALDIPLRQPEAGDRVSDYSTIETPVFTAEIAGWYRQEGADNFVPVDGYFTPGSYIVDLKILAKDGYAFSKSLTAECVVACGGKLPADYAHVASWETVWNYEPLGEIGYVVNTGFTFIVNEPSASVYTVTEGDKTTYDPNQSKTLLLVSDAPFDKFVELRVDGVVVELANYTAESGSTRITLKSAYLQTLTAGEHTFTIVSTDGEASGTFTISATPSNDEPDPVGGPVESPKTGDVLFSEAWIILAGAAALSAAILLYAAKCSRHFTR